MLQKLKSLKHIHRKQQQYERRITALIRVLMEMMVPSYDAAGTMRGILQFREAYELYSSYFINNIDQEQFRDNLLHPEWGLCINIIFLPVINVRFLVFKTNVVDIPLLISLVSPPKEGLIGEINSDLVKKILSTMESEWDKTCAKMLFSMGKNRSAIESCGIDVDTVNSKKEKFAEVYGEINRTMTTAIDLVQERLENKEKKLSQDVANLERLIEIKSTYWREERMTELEEKKETLETNLKAVKELLNPPNKHIESKRKRMVGRTASNLSEERRVKRRKLRGGAPSKLDSENERFIANAIESKATYHGRRHGTIMYTNRRVKSRDLKNIANHNLRNRGKKEIKSATTAWNRSAPCNKRSRQAKLHKGN